MWQKISDRPYVLALLAGFSAVLAFPPLDLVPFIFGTLFFLCLSTFQAQSLRHAFRLGFAASLAVMVGGFYWVIYTLHIFGSVPWIVAALLYLGFCGFGALNFPLFTTALYAADRRWNLRDRRSIGIYALAIPALFTAIEVWIPKLFPWSLGHCFYKTLWLNQIVEWTGVAFLTFAIASVGCVAAFWLRARPATRRDRIACVGIPLSLWGLCFAVSWWRFDGFPGKTRPFQVSLIQANIGSLDHLQIRGSLGGRVQTAVGRYVALTDLSLTDRPKPDLIVWPETAVPFVIASRSPYSERLQQDVLRWNTPLVTGAYAVSAADPNRDYNSAYLLEPTADKNVRMELYHKNILLAFGEYFPFGEIFPSLYHYFPQVSNFARGRTQNYVSLGDGTRVGVTICYEAILPSFFRKVAQKGVHLVVNLTNDSWFGATSEPYQHAALSVFRAIESRVPLLRVTNTGTSFVIDRYGRRTQGTPLYREAFAREEVQIPVDPIVSFYVRFGEWFALLCMAVLIGTACRWEIRGRRGASLSTRI